MQKSMDGSTSGASICNSVVLKFRDLKTDSLGFFMVEPLIFKQEFFQKALPVVFLQ